jgi:TrmH family RNA methyltransferase
MPITSSSNAQIVALKKILSDKKYRTEYGLYAVEGEKLVREAVKYGAAVEKVFIKETLAEKFDFLDGLTVEIVADRVFDAIADTVTTQGIIALVKISDQQPSLTGNALILENLQDAGNVGTLLRTALATDFRDVFLVNCVDVYSPKVTRSAAGATYRLNCVTAASTEEVFAELNGYSILSADMGGTDVFAFQPSGKFAVLVGNEGNGISDFARNNSTQIIAIPMKNQLESLNAAVSGSIIMYALTRN